MQRGKAALFTVTMDLFLLLLRVLIGGLFLVRGTRLLLGWFDGRGLTRTAAFFETLGLRSGWQLAVAIGGFEVVGGLLFVSGWLTPLGGALLSASAFVALWLAHPANGLIRERGFEYNLVLLAALVGATFAIVAAGPGGWSLDHAVGVADDGIGWAFGQLAVGALYAAGTVALVRPRRGRGSVPVR